MNGMESPKPDSTLLILQVHLAEYQALTTRITYWLTLQYAIYSAGFVYLAIAVQGLGSGRVNPRTLAWITMLLFQFLGLAWAECGHEMLFNGLYMETELRQRVGKLVSTGDFWLYEPFLARHRGEKRQRLRESLGLATFAIVTLCAAALVVWVLASNRPWCRRDYFWLLVNSLTLPLLAHTAIKVFRVKQKLQVASRQVAVQGLILNREL
jgi:hypothetical protein